MRRAFNLGKGGLKKTVATLKNNNLTFKFKVYKMFLSFTTN